MNSFPSRMRTLISLLPLFAASLLGSPVAAWAQEDAATDEARTPPPASAAQMAAEARLPKLTLTPKILYQVLLAEIAGNRGSVILATGTYLDLARSTRDPRIARRAAEIALYARQPEAALEATQIWVAADPEAPLARQMLASLLLGAQRVDDAERQLAILLTLETPAAENASGSGGTPALAERLDGVLRMLSRHPDKVIAQRLVEHLTVPYEAHPEAHFARAMAAASAGDENRALETLERALALRPDWDQAILFKAQLQQRGNTALAVQTLRDFLARHPDAHDVRLAYARSLIGDKHYEAARREFSTLLARQPDNGEAIHASALLSLQLGDHGAAEQYLKRMLTMGIGNLNLARYYLGQVAEETKRPQEALEWYEQVTASEQYLPAQSRAALLLGRQGQVDAGRALLRKAAEAVPAERLTLLIGEAQLLSEFDRHVEAFNLLSDELVRQPDQPDLLYESALLAEKMDSLEVLERNLRRLIQLKPDEARGYNALGYSLADRNVRLDEAQQLIDKALALSPNEAYIIDSKGWLLYRRNDNSGALELLRKAFELHPDPEIAAHLGELLWITGKREEARKTWKEAARLNPTNRLLGDTIRKFKP